MMNFDAVTILRAIIAAVDDELGACPLTPEDIYHDTGIALPRVRMLISRLAENEYIEPMAWRIVQRDIDAITTVGLVEGAGGNYVDPDPEGIEVRIVRLLWDYPMQAQVLADALGMPLATGALVRALAWLSGPAAVLYPLHARWPTAKGRALVEKLPTGEKK
jgi:hypothetical protein